jgi:hypothetical protein
MTARHVRYVRLRLKALRNDPRLLFRRPSSPALPARNHLNPLISATFVPGIKHGSYHRAASRYQRMTANIARNPCAREVGRSNRLRSIRFNSELHGRARVVVCLFRAREPSCSQLAPCGLFVSAPGARRASTLGGMAPKFIGWIH